MAFPLILGIWLGLFSTMVIIIGITRNTGHTIVHTIADIVITEEVIVIEVVMVIAIATTG